MNAEITALVETGRGQDLLPIAAEAQDYLRSSKADNTLKAYQSDWRHFSAWCKQQGLIELPAAPETISLYLTHMARTFKPTTLQRRLASISVAHKAAGYESPTGKIVVLNTLRGIRRKVSITKKKAAPVRVNHLRQLAADLPETIQGKRDKALTLIGYAGAFRRSELAALTVDDLEFTTEGVAITVRRSKTDQEGHGFIKGIGYGANPVTCPVKALQAWLDASRITSGRVFRSIDRHGNIGQSISGKAVDLILKRVNTQIGIGIDGISGHSLRSGFITDQYKRGTPENDIMLLTGHKSRAVLSDYRQEADAFHFNYVAAVGL